MASWKTYLETNQDRYLKELLEFLRLPSISSLRAHKADVQKAADWVAARLQTAGLENVQVLPTGGHPVVYGDWLHVPNKPTVMIYGHFDTQPVDPLELWSQPPFEPVVEEERVYARGASDDKGNMLAPILALEAVRPLSDIEQARIDEIPYDESDYKAQLGVDELFGESGYSTYERAWTRPTLEVNGIWGGFQDEGFKTVLPSTAHAKISCRLVSDQDPQEIVERVTAHIHKHAPPGVAVKVRPDPSTAYPYVIPHDHPGNRIARSVHQALFGKEPYYARMGGSIPVCGIFLKELGVYTVNFAFGLKDENVHGPNEFFRLKSFSRAQLAYGMLLQRLSEWEIK